MKDMRFIEEGALSTEIKTNVSEKIKVSELVDSEELGLAEVDEEMLGIGYEIIIKP